MRKLVILGLVVGLTLTAVSVAHADPLSDWIWGMFGSDPTQGDPIGGGGAMPAGDGSGMGV